MSLEQDIRTVEIEMNLTGGVTEQVCLLWVWLLR